LLTKFAHFFLENTEMHIVILTFQGFNEIDAFVALNILNRVKQPDWRVSICCREKQVTSMNGVTIFAQSDLSDAKSADAVLVGSGRKTREVTEDLELMNALQLDPTRQLIGSQCSGTLILAKLGILGTVPACTDLVTKPWVQEAGITVLDQPFYAKGSVATAGGCASAPYLAGWIIAKSEGIEAAASAIQYVAPVGEKEEYVARMRKNIQPYL
jgi:transcriptional regulator GlxA family with amidase domain